MVAGVRGVWSEAGMGVGDGGWGGGWGGVRWGFGEDMELGCGEGRWVWEGCGGRRAEMQKCPHAEVEK